MSIIIWDIVGDHLEHVLPARPADNVYEEIAYFLRLPRVFPDELPVELLLGFGEPVEIVLILRAGGIAEYQPERVQVVVDVFQNLLGAVAPHVDGGICAPAHRGFGYAAEVYLHETVRRRLHHRAEQPGFVPEPRVYRVRADPAVRGYPAEIRVVEPVFQEFLLRALKQRLGHARRFLSYYVSPLLNNIVIITQLFYFVKGISIFFRFKTVLKLQLSPDRAVFRLFSH